MVKDNTTEESFWRNAYKTLFYERRPRHSRNVQNVFTPYGLCEEIVGGARDFIELSNRNFLVGNLEFAIILVELGVPKKNILFFSDCKEKIWFAKKFGVKYEMCDFLTWETKIMFDVVIMNPPYKNRLHESFLKKALKASKEFVITIQPTGWLLCERKNDSLIPLIDRHLKRLTLINGNPLFDVEIHVPCGILTINKKEKCDEIEIFDEISQSVSKVTDINQINIFNDYCVYGGLKNKILDFAKKNNMFSYTNSKGDFYVNVAKIRGHLNKSDFYTFVMKNDIPSKKPEKQYFGFASLEEANNFTGYLKTFFARFCLAIYKSNTNMHQGEFKGVPWLDFSQKWDDEKLFKHFSLAKKEIDFIYKVIVEYY